MIRNFSTSRTRTVVIVALLLLSPTSGAQEVRYKPPILPIEITWSAQNGVGINFESPALVTPIGQFSISLSLTDAQKAMPNRKILVIVVGKESFVYDLRGQDFRLKLPRNIKGHSILEYSDGNIYLEIPNPQKLSAPERLDIDGARNSGTIQRGKISLTSGKGYSFSLKKITSSRSDLYFGGLTLDTYAILSLGPTDIDSPKTIPPLTRRKGMLGNLFSIADPSDGKWHHGGAESIFLVTGHVYAVCLSERGPYALIQIKNLHLPTYSLDYRIELAYKLQKNGTRNF